MVREEAVLNALDKPRSLTAILRVVDPNGSYDHLQDLLMKMRDEGKLKFDIKKGFWSRAK